MSPIALPEPDVGVISRREAIAAEIGALGTDALIITQQEGLRAFETDALTAYKRLPLLVVLPSTTEDVSAILRYCHENKLKVVARGAGTSLCGGALPEEDAVVLGVSRMNRVLDVCTTNRTATVQTGITNLGISQAVAKENFFYAPDPSSQLACTLAGNIAMNSGGAHCLRYGVTTNNLLGVKMVLMNGEVLELGGEHLDAAGYDFLGLITGSEGQFGIVTEATVRILRKPEKARPMLIGFSSAEAAGACVASIIGSGLIPVALEYMDQQATHVCEEFAEAGYPLHAEALLIVEVEGTEKDIEYQFKKISEISRNHDPVVIRAAETDEESDRIWKGRKSAFGAMGRLADYLCMDGTIPTGQLPAVLREISKICTSYGFRVANIFHAGDGNLHPLILYNANDPVELERVEECGAEILRLCVEVGGCLTGEHGVGIEKRELMPLQFTEADLEQQMRIKDVFDPEWLLNPAKVFPLESRGARPKTG